MAAPPFLRQKARLAGIALILVASGCVTPTAEHPPYAGLVSLDYAHSQKARDALRQAMADAGKDTARLASIEGDLVAMLGRTDTTFAGRQVICENLGILFASSFARGDHPVPPVLVRMLLDEKQVDLARMALERAPGAAVDAVFVSGLAQSAGRVRTALIQSVGNRRSSSAVPVLGNLLQDPETKTAAAKALGQIGGRVALDALGKSPDQAAAPVVEARIACARGLAATEALPVLVAVSADAAIAAPLRAPAFVALLSLEPDTASRRIAEALGGKDMPRRQAVLASLASLPAGTVIPVVAADSMSWDLQTQAAAVMALGSLGDPSALPVLLEAARSDDPGLRRAAIAALGQLPGNGDVALLLAGASNEAGETGKVARQSLSRLNGPGVAEVVLGGATRTGNPLRPVFLEELALRNAPGAAGILMGARDDPAVAVRCAALDGLAIVAPAGEESSLISWMNSAADTTEQSHALRAVVGAAGRNPDPKARLKPVADIIGSAPPAVQARLLAALSRMGGTTGADYVATLALGRDAALARSAVAALGNWTDHGALGALATVAERTRSDVLRKAAVEGAIQALEADAGDLSKEERTAAARLRAVTKDPELARRLTALDKGAAK